MAIDQLKIKFRGPVFLQEQLGELQDAINERTPLKGLGIALNETENGVQISTEQGQSPTDAAVQTGNSGSGGTPGTAVDLYGALNGAPATFHILQSADPTPIT